MQQVYSTVLYTTVHISPVQPLFCPDVELSLGKMFCDCWLPLPRPDGVASSHYYDDGEPSQPTQSMGIILMTENNTGSSNP